ncbi:unnamed protein product, partial [marine sediment metagenome]
AGKKIEISTSINCPDGIVVNYKEIEVSPSEKKFDVFIDIEKTRETAGQFPIKFYVISGNTSHEVVVPCIYVSGINKR